MWRRSSLRHTNFRIAADALSGYGTDRTCALARIGRMNPIIVPLKVLPVITTAAPATSRAIRVSTSV